MDDTKSSMTPKQRAIMFVVVVTNLTTAFMGSALNLSVPAIGAEFSVGATTLTWVVSSFSLTLGALCLPAGSLADATGRRRVLLAGLALFVVASIICAAAPSMALLIFGRVVGAVGSAMIQAANIPIMVSAFPPEKRGMVLGFGVSAIYVGLSLGPVFGGIINQMLGWRAIFVIAAAFMTLSFLLAIRNMPNDRREGSHINDVPGNLLYISAIFCILFGLSNWSVNAYERLLVPVGTVLLVLFVIRELHTDAPVLDVRIFKSDRAFTFSNLAALLSYASTMAISYSLSIYLQTVRGMSSGAAGLFLICQPVVMALLSPICGHLSDRIAPYKLASFGMGLSAAGLFGLSFIGVDSPLAIVVISLVVIGAGFGFFSSPNTNAVLSCVDKSQYGVANAVLSTMRTLGQSISLVIIMFVFASLLGDVLVADADPAVLTGAIHTVLLISCAICAVGVVFSLMRTKKSK